MAVDDVVSEQADSTTRSLSYSIDGSNSKRTSFNASANSSAATTPTSDLGIEDLGDVPRPICIVRAEDNHAYTLKEEALSSILLKDGICDKHVVVVSVAGAFRKGKSFLLDFFLRYMMHGGNDGWLGAEDEKLTGFPWRGGSERFTTGINMWSEPFLVRIPSGEEVVVLLMDTQGAFDQLSTVKDCATIFALSTMTSSVQVYNLSQNIQEDDLQHLQLFTDYGRLALEQHSDNKPFQHLQFLVRDWPYPYEAEWGAEGGAALLERRLRVSTSQHSELQQVRTHIRDCFERVSCFLLPHPGFKVATSPKFEGQLKDIEDEFKAQLLDHIPSLLAPSNLVVKEINGCKVTCAELLMYFKAYLKIYSGDTLPEPKSMLLATAEANNLAAVAKAKSKYTRDMEDICGGEMSYMHPDALEKEHNRLMEESMKCFNQTAKMGGAAFSKKYSHQLNEEILELWEHFQKHNESKNVFSAARTPGTLFASIVLLYLTSSFLGLVGAYSLANMFTILLYTDMILLTIWAYVRFSGEYRDAGLYIDYTADFMWDVGVVPTYKWLLRILVSNTLVNAIEPNSTRNNETDFLDGVQRPAQSFTPAIARQFSTGATPTIARQLSTSRTPSRLERQSTHPKSQ